MMKKIQQFTILFFSGIIFIGCLQKFNNYGVVDTMIASAGNNTVTVLVAENKATSYQQNGGFVKTTYSVTYWLKQYEINSGKLLHKKAVFSPDESNQTSIACYGRLGNHIWMYREGLVAFDINTLEEVTNEKKIATANGVSKTIFPLDDRLVTPVLDKGHIDFIRDNGEAYRLTLKDLKINKKTGEENEDNADAKKIKRLLHDDEYGVRCDSMNNKIFVFAQNEEAAEQSSPDHTGISETAYRMKLFKTDFSIRTLGSHNSFTIENIQQATADTYLNPCFVMDTYTGKVIHLSNPEGYLVIHQDVLGEKSKALITRIDTNGKKVWEKPMGVSTKIEGCTLQGKYLLVRTNKDYMLSPFIGKDALCIVDIENGNIILPALTD